MNLLDLMVKIGVDDEASEKISRTSETIKSKLSNAAKVGAAATAALAAGTIAFTKGLTDAVNATAEYGDLVDKTSQKLGLSSEAYQKWDYVLNISGTSMQNCSMGLKTLTNKLDDAKNGSEKAQGMFEQLGLSMEDLNSMSREEVFEATIRGFQGMSDSTERAALANDLFGRSGQELTPLFNTSIEETEKLMAATEQYGMVMSDKAVKASAAFVDAQTTLDKTLSGAKNRITAEFLPALTDVVDGLTQIFSGGVDEGLKKVSQGVKDAISKVTEMAPRAISAGVKLVASLAKGLAQNFPAMIRQFGEMIIELIDEIPEHLDEMLDSAGMLFMEIASAMTDVAPRILSSLAKLVLSLVQSVISRAPDMLAGALQLFGEIAVAIARAAGDILPAIGNLLGSILLAVVNYVSEMVQAGGMLVQGIIDGIMGKDTDASKAASDIIKNIADGARKLISNFIGIGGKIVSSLIDGIKGFWNNLFGIGQDMTEKVGSGAENKSKGMKAIGKDVADSYSSGVESGSGSAYGAGSDLGYSAKSGASQYSLYYSGKNLADSLASGIWDNIWYAASAAADLGAAAAAAANDALRINSPSKVFMGIGQSIDEGFALGIEKDSGDVIDAVTSLSNDVYGAANGEMDFGVAYGSRSGVTVSVGQLIVREEADVNRIAEQLYDLSQSRTGARLWSL